ncbi:MAG: Ig-like domain-containing protein [Myxococcota bacterium]
MRRRWWVTIGGILAALAAWCALGRGAPPPAQPEVPAPVRAVIPPPPPAPPAPAAAPAPVPEVDADRAVVLSANRQLAEALGYNWVECPAPGGDALPSWSSDLPYLWDAEGIAFASSDAEGVVVVYTPDDQVTRALLRWSVDPDGTSHCQRRLPSVAETTVHVVDPDGNPIPDIIVYERSVMRSSLRTDADGIARVETPADTQLALELTVVLDGTIFDLTTVSMPSGVERTVEVDLDAGVPFRLARGRELRERLDRGEEQIGTIDALLNDPTASDETRAVWRRQHELWASTLDAHADDLLPDGSLRPRPPRHLPSGP